MPQTAASQSIERVRQSLSTGAWLTAERLRVYPAIILTLFVLAILALVATGHGGMDFAGRPLGVDFSGQWVAGTEVLAGLPAQPYDNAAHAARQAAAFGASGSYLPWNYPPFTLALAAAFASMPYLPALAGWMAATVLFYLAAVRRMLRSSGVAANIVVTSALGFPAVAINVLHGQNGCLSAGLMTFGALHLPRRPLLAGFLLALLAYKPQFLLAVPVVLLAGGFGRASVAFVLTLVLLVLASVLGFGVAPWHGFLQSLAFSRSVILEGGGLESYKLQSAFAAVRLLGGSLACAYAIQVCTSLCVVAGLAALWRRGSTQGAVDQGQVDHGARIAGLLIASLLVTPYAVDYDMVLLGPALAALLALRLDTGFMPYEKSFLALVWLVPLVARLGGFTLHLPLGWLVTATLFAGLVGAHLRGAALRGTGRLPVALSTR